MKIKKIIVTLMLLVSTFSCLSAMMPDFILHDYVNDRAFSLSMYRGKPVIMFLFDSPATLQTAYNRMTEKMPPQAGNLNYFGICINGELSDDLTNIVQRYSIECPIGAVNPSIDMQYQTFFLNLKKQGWLPHYMLIDENGVYFYDFTETIANDQIEQNLLLLTRQGYRVPAFSATALANSDQSIDIPGNHDRLLFLNFWATWCGPCQEEIPALNKLSKKYADSLDIIGVSVDKNDQIVTTWLASNEVDYPVCRADKKTQDLYGGIYSVPTTFIINRGKIIYRFTGSLSYEEFEFLFHKYSTVR